MGTKTSCVPFWPPPFGPAFEEPAPPRRLNRAIPAELETIVLKAMAKAPEERYATAGELADDLQRFLKDEPIRARRPTLVQRLRKWARRRRAAVTTAMVSLALLVLTASAILAVSLTQIWKEREDKLQEAKARAAEEGEKKEALEKEKKALEKEKEALERYRKMSSFQRVALALTEWRENRVRQANDYLDLCPKDLRAWEWYYLKGLCHSELFSASLAVSTYVFAPAAFSPDGEWIAVKDGLQVRLYSAATGEETRHFQMSGGRYDEKHAVMFQVNEMSFSPDSKRLAVGGAEHRLINPSKEEVWDSAIVWDIATEGRLMALKGLTGQKAVFGMWGPTFSPDGWQVAAGDGRGNVFLWDAASGQQRQHLVVHHLPQANSYAPTRVAFSPDGVWLASACEDGPTVKIWNTRSGELVRELGLSEGFGRVAFGPKGGWLAAARLDHAVSVWDAQSGKLRCVLGGHTGRITSLVFSPDGDQLVTGSEDTLVKRWDVERGRELATYRGNARDLLAVAFRDRGRQVALVDGLRLLKHWDARRGPEAVVLRGIGRAFDAAFSPDGRRAFMRARTFQPRLEQLEDRCAPSCVSNFVTPLAPLGNTVTSYVSSGLPGGGSTFGQQVVIATGTSVWGSLVSGTAQSC